MNKYLIALLAGVSLLGMPYVVKASAGVVASEGSGTNQGVSFEELLGTGVDTDAVSSGISSLTSTATGAWANVTSQVGSLVKNADVVQKALTLTNDPNGLFSLATGGMPWAQVQPILENASKAGLMSFMNIPPAGIPIEDPRLKNLTKQEQAKKTETARLDEKTSEEKQKQLETVGANPGTPVGEGTPAQQELVENPEEEPSVDACPAQVAALPKQTQKAYEYVKKFLLDKEDKSQYGRAQETMDAAVKYVEKTFFVKPDKEKQGESTAGASANLTAETMKKAMKKRYDYQREVVADVLALGIGVQKFLVEDAKSISEAITSGCNEIDDLNVGTTILISMAKQTIADIVLQMKLMEFDGIHHVYDKEVELLEDPDKAETGNAPAETPAAAQ